MKQLSVVVIDDEPLCRQDLRDVLGKFPHVNFLGEAETLPEATDLIHKAMPDLLFLDLSLGHRSGFDFFRSISPAPLCIAVTADPTQGATAFDFDFVDYLVKPVEEARLGQALKRAIRRIGDDRTRQMPTFLVEISKKKVLLQGAEIQQIAAMGNYVVLHSGKGKGILRSTMRETLAQFPKGSFLQLSRGRWIAHDQIEGWEKKASKLFLCLKDKTLLPVSRRNKSSLLRFLTPPPEIA